jgi:hypothetical protein
MIDMFVRDQDALKLCGCDSDDAQAFRYDPARKACVYEYFCAALRSGFDEQGVATAAAS